MLFTTAQREDLYSAIPPQLDFIECGVFKGENAARIASVASPRSITLVDQYRAQTHADYPHLEADEFEQLMEYSSGYYGGRPDVQKTHENIFRIAERNLAGYKAITSFVKMSTTSFFKQCREQQYDVVYIDASHQYEGVLADLKGVAGILRPGGLIFMNDAAVNHRANQQNMGVLQAALTAIKLYGFCPIVITNNPYADLVLAMPHTDTVTELSVAQKFLQNLELIEHDFMEFPSELLGTFNQRIPFGFSNRLVSSFVLERYAPSGIVSNIQANKEILAKGPQLVPKRSMINRIKSRIFRV